MLICFLHYKLNITKNIYSNLIFFMFKNISILNFNIKFWKSNLLSFLILEFNYFFLTIKTNWINKIKEDKLKFIDRKKYELFLPFSSIKKFSVWCQILKVEIAMEIAIKTIKFGNDFESIANNRYRLDYFFEFISENNHLKFNLLIKFQHKLKNS